jgi:predicted nucleotidyltransferase
LRYGGSCDRDRRATSLFLYADADRGDGSPARICGAGIVASGFLLRRQDGRRVYFKANTESPLYPELRGLFEKTAGIIPELKAAIDKFGGRIELALLYGSIARGEEHASSDIDLMAVGTLRQIDLLPVLRKLESRFRREVNVTLFSPEEFIGD